MASIVEATPADAAAAAELERVCYSADVAASPERIAERIRDAPSFFLLARDDAGALVGMVNATRARAHRFPAESMRRHEHDGGSLCVHSVSVRPDARRRGLGLRLLRELERVARAADGVQRLLLICKDGVRPLYERAGYSLDGPCAFEHGSEPRVEMRLELLELSFSHAAPEDAAAAAELEALCFPPDEAASPKRVAERIHDASRFFLLARDPGGGVVAMINGTLARAEHLLDESMERHEPDGGSLCVHSVSVHPDARRRGVALRMLRRLERVARETDGVQRMLLICKDRLRVLYERAGYSLVGPSAVVHGKDQWYEMRIAF